MHMKNEIAIVTGGGGAIGRAICEALAGEGAKLAVLDLSWEAARKTVAELKARGADAEAWEVDVTNYAGVEKAVEEVRKRWGRVDVLVNAAGGSARGQMREFGQQTLEVIHRIIDVNLFGALHCLRAVVPLMIAARKGSIVNVTSIVATGGKKGCVEYGAAKGGLIAATRSLALELGPHRIRINCVSPGLVPREPVADEAAFARKYSVMERICTPADVARAVLFFALSESEVITGQNLAVDGGRGLGLRGD